MAWRKRTASGSNARTATTLASSRRTRSGPSRNDVPDIYREMLVEADVQPNQVPERPIKRRRPAQRNDQTLQRATHARAEKASEVDEQEDDENMQFEDVSLPVAAIQTIERDTDEEEEDGLGFEDVDFSAIDLDAVPITEASNTLELNLSARTAANPRKAVDRRKPINKAEKDRRVEIHKAHLLCLLAHVSRRNRWCNDHSVQDALRPLLTKKMVTYLNPDQSLPQFGRTQSLKNGLQDIINMFKVKFQITERGMRRALWAESEEHLKNYQLPDDAETPMEKSDFGEGAKSLKGSRDVGAQLFCALLRSAGVEARLVCSLQPLSFLSGGPPMGKPPSKKGKLSLGEQYARMPKYDNSFDSPATASPSLSARRRLGHPNAAAFQVPMTYTASSSVETPPAPRKIRESPFPVYWVEILDEAHQKWQPVDPLVTESFWRPHRLEPPASDRENCMTYVVGFEADGTAKDVTRRYAKAYNAKTRKMRIESASPIGEKWWHKALRAYSRSYATDLDQIESNELTATESREPMPRNVADFKDHPIYALERHLRRHEVLIPNAAAAGTVGAGSKGPLEKIYRRKDVRIARSREKWYRLGREVRPDEIPVKFLPKRAKTKTDFSGDEEGDGVRDTVGTPIYTIDQTDLYKTPPVINGRIPKNRYGNLDIYVPSMVPEGGAYIADELGAQAAFTLGVDYAPALTGFQFKGRQGTAVLHGVVVAAEHEEAVRVVIAGLKDQEAEIEQEQRTREVLRTWRMFLMNLRVRQRIWADVDSDEEGVVDTEATDLDKGKAVVEHDDEEREDYEDSGGGFVIDDGYAGGFVN
ncbi:hypothetical protein DL764_008584 [Monosporascus ibericus]|uniref:Rad4 beta-hairpin domain-containing protein n=1 Tax=Monosporascus ibericus TaxID=155417 RepID=A0A4Q4SZC6_9PEZI|nr:hypothetical protein DL764_008584 [Monosporascus ibericus]